MILKMMVTAADTEHTLSPLQTLETLFGTMILAAANLSPSTQKPTEDDSRHFRMHGICGKQEAFN